MLYAAYQAQSDLMAPFRIASSVLADAIPHLPRSLSDLPLVRRTARFNQHRDFIVALLKHPPARRALLKPLASLVS